MLCSICNSVSKSPEDSIMSAHHPSFLEVVGDFTDTSFRVHFHSFFICLSSTTVVFSADQVVVGIAGGFQTLDFSMPFGFCYSSN